MHQDIKEILITEQQLHDKTKELAAAISEDFNGKDLLVISVLKGSFIFAADLMRALTIDASIDFMVVSSYGTSTKTSGVVQIRKDLDRDIRGMHVLIAEDILDSGLTLSFLKKQLLQKGAADVKICTILNKSACRKADIDADYIGFDIPDEFVVGYGLDYAEKYRNLPYVGVLKPEVYEGN